MEINFTKSFILTSVFSLLLFAMPKGLQAQCSCSGNITVTNPSFESGTTGWNWSGGYFNASTGAVKCGSKSGDFQITNSSNNWVSQTIAQGTLPVGTSITATVWAGVHNNNYYQSVSIGYFTSNWTWISGTNVEVNKVLAASPVGPQLYTINSTVPANAYYVQIAFSGNGDWIKTDQWCVNANLPTCNPNSTNASSGFCAPSPNCSGSNKWTWSQSINQTTGSPSVVRLINSSKLYHDITSGIPSAAQSGPVTISVTDAVSWDGYPNRYNVTQTNERWRLKFYKGSTVVHTTPYTNDVQDQVKQAYWRGALGSSVTLANGFDKVRIEHIGGSGPGSVVPSSFCVSYSSCDNVTNAGVIAGAENKCGPYNPTTITSTSPASGGSGGPIEYIWIKNSTASTTGSTDIVGATGLTYDPPTIDKTTYYRRCARRPGCNDYIGETNWIKKEVKFCAPTPTCSGTDKYSWSQTINPTTGAPSVVRLINSSKLTHDITSGFPSAVTSGPINITITEAVSYDGYVGRSNTSNQPDERWRLKFYKGSTLVHTSPYTSDGLATGIEQDSWVGALGSQFTLNNGFDKIRIEHYAVANSGGSPGSVVPASFCIKYTPVCTPLTNGGSIASNQTFCNSGDPALFTSVSLPSGGVGPITYRWQKSEDNGVNWLTNTSANSATYDPVGAITTTTWYRRQAKTPCGSWVNSDTVKVTVNKSLSSPGTIGSPQTFCNSGDPALLTSVAAASGGSGGTIQYQWYSYVQGVGPWTLIPGATAATYNPPTITASTHYRRGAKRSVCGSLIYTPYITMTVNKEITTAGTIGSPQTFCNSGDPATFTNTSSASGGSGGTIQYVWQKSTNNSTWSTISGATSSTYNAPTVTTTTYYRRGAKRSVCGSYDYTSSVKVTVNKELTTPGAIGSPQTFCNSGNPAAFTNTTSAGGGTGGTVTYQWQSSTNNSTWVNISGATAATYDAPAITATTYYRRAAKRSVCGNYIYTSSVKVTVDKELTTAGAIGSPQTFCNSGDPAAFTNTTSASGGSGGTVTYQWQSSANNSTWTNISGATSSTYNAPSITATTYYRRAAKRSVCGNYKYTSSVKVTINKELTTPGAIGSPQSFCNSGNPAAFTNTTSAGGGTGGTVTYQWQSSTNNSTWTNISAATASTYNAGTITATTYYRRAAKRSVCGNYKYTSSVKVTIQPGVDAGTDGSTTVCDHSTATINLAGLITGEDAGGTWTRTQGTGGTFNASAGTYVPAVGATTSKFKYTLTGTSPCPNDNSYATVNIDVCQIIISGKVFNDVDGLTDNNVDGVGIGSPSSTPIYANLVNSADKVEATTTINSNGTYQFPAVTTNTTYTMVLSTIQGTVGNNVPAPNLPTNWMNTGESPNNATSDGTVDGKQTVSVGIVNVPNIDFGIQQPPAPGTKTEPSQVNPGGNTFVTIPSNAFSGIDPNPGVVSSLRITSFPSNAQRVRINGTIYTAANWPTAGVNIPTNANGVPTQTVQVDPINGAVTVNIPYKVTDNAGVESSTAGYVKKPFTVISLSGNVFEDSNGETNVDGTPISSPDNTQLYAHLVYTNGNIYKTTPIAANGTYNFAEVKPNTSYSVVLSTTQGVVGNAAPAAALPIQWVNISEDCCDNTGNDGNTNGELVVAMATSDQVNANFGIAKLGKIGNYAWLDANSNGIQDSIVDPYTFDVLNAEVVAPNIRVNLYNATTNSIIDSADTDAQGKYEFVDLKPGDYYIGVDNSSFPDTGYVLSPLNAGSDNTIDNDIAMGTYKSANINLQSGEIDNTWDIGIYLSGDPEITDPCVCTDTLLYGLGFTQYTYGETVEVLATPGDTWVVVPGPHSTTGYQTQGISIVKGTDGFPSPYDPNTERLYMTEIAPGRYALDFFHADSIGYEIVVSNGVDTLSITNLCYNAPEMNTVILPEFCLYDTAYSLQNVFPTGVSNYYKLKDGAFSFANNNDTIPPINTLPQLSSINPSLYTDGDTIAIIVVWDPNSTQALAPNGQPFTACDVTTIYNVTFKKSNSCTVALGNDIWEDTDRDGIKDATEAAIANAIVKLYTDTNSDGTPDAAAIMTVTSNSSGSYAFDTLAPGKYIVGVTPPVPTSGNPFVSSVVSEMNPNNDVDNNDNGIVTTNGETFSGTIDLEVGGEPTGESGATTLSPDDNSNLTVDFGFFQPITLTGIVFNDESGPAQVDGSPIGQASGNQLYANLIDATGNVEAVEPVSNFGTYEFLDLDPNTAYSVVLSDVAGTLNNTAPPASLPVGWLTVSEDCCDGIGNDGDPNGINLIQTSLSDINNANFGIREPVAIGNSVWVDSNKNGIKDAGELPMSGAVVNLYIDNNSDNTPDGAPIATMTTGNNGLYKFVDLKSGSYLVGVTPPTVAGGNYESSVIGQEDNPNLDVDNNDNGITKLNNEILSKTVVLIANTEPQGETPNNTAPVPDSNSNLTIDFGFFVCPANFDIPNVDVCVGTTVDLTTIEPDDFTGGVWTDSATNTVVSNPTAVTSGTYTYTFTSGDCSASGNVSLIDNIPDYTPNISIQPNTINGVSNVRVKIEISEILNKDGCSDLYILVPKLEPRFFINFVDTATSINGMAVENENWQAYPAANPNFFVWQYVGTDGVFPGGSTSTLGYVGPYDPNNTDGMSTYSVQIFQGSGGETNQNNNTDSDLLIYFR